MTTIIPQNRRWSITNSSDVFGDLFFTYNIHMDELGYVTVSPKSVSFYSTIDDSSFGLPLNVVPFDSGFFVLTSDQPFQISNNMAISEIGSGSAPSDFGFNSDAVNWQGKIYATTNDDLVSVDTSGSWSTGILSLTASVPHPLEVMGNFSSGNLCVGNDNTVRRLATGESVSATLTLNANYQVTCLKYFNSNLYIGTKEINGGEAKVFVWNGQGTSAQAEFKTGARHAFSIEEYQSSIVAITSEGQLIRFTGGGFQELAHFPVYTSPYSWASGGEKVRMRGLRTVGDRLYVAINGTVSKEKTDVFFLPNQPSGIWCYDPNVGLYCRNLPTTDKLTEVTVSSLSSNTLTLASSTNLKTGEPVLVSALGSLTGIESFGTYYAVVVSPTEIKLAVSPADAKNENILAMGGTVGSAKVKVHAYKEFGQRYLGSSGEIGGLGILSPLSASFFPDMIDKALIWGYTSDSITYHLNGTSPASNIGGFITSKIWSSQVTDIISKVHLKYAGVNLDHESIVFKHRDRDEFGKPTRNAEGTFSNKRVVGSDSASLSDVNEGDSINIVAGNGSPRSLSIQDIVGDEYYLEDEVWGAVSADSVTFNVDNFEKTHNAIDASSQENFRTFPLEGDSSWRQFMFEMTGQNVKIEEIKLADKTQESIN